MANCNDCLCVDVCKMHSDIVSADYYPKILRKKFEEESNCPHFKDRTRFVELPCKVGDIIYEICERKKGGEWKKAIVKRAVHGIEIGLGGCMVARSGTTVVVFLSDLGKTVFLTREEAEKALEVHKNI